MQFHDRAGAAFAGHPCAVCDRLVNEEDRVGADLLADGARVVHWRCYVAVETARADAYEAAARLARTSSATADRELQRRARWIRDQLVPRLGVQVPENDLLIRR